MRKRIYICGPMTVLPELNRPAFYEADGALWNAGYEPVNPALLPDGWTWQEYMRRGIANLMTCEGLATLPGWENSKGATIEANLAQQLDIPRKTVQEWIEEAGR